MIKFFLLAAGYGKRARPLSLFKPKPLFPLHGTPLIELILQKFKYKGVEKGFINLCYRSAEIKKKINDPDKNVIFFYEKQLSGSKILKKAVEYLDDSFLLVINGDVFLDVPVVQMEEKIFKSEADGILLVRYNKSFNYSSLDYHRDQYKGIHKNSQKGIMYAGVALLRRSVVDKIDDLSFFQTLDKFDFDIRILFYDGIWLDVGDPHSYFRSNFEYLRYQKIFNNLNSNSFSENVFVSSDSRVENTIIWENTSINNKSVIMDSIVTGNVKLDHVCYQHKIITDRDIFDL